MKKKRVKSTTRFCRFEMVRVQGFFLVRMHSHAVVESSIGTTITQFFQILILKQYVEYSPSSGYFTLIVFVREKLRFRI